MDLKLDSTGDLDITNGKLSLVDGLYRIRQQGLIRLRFLKGEWFLDAREGMPYFQEILGVKPFSETLARTRSRAALLGISGVLDVKSMEFELDGATRELSVDWAAIAEVDGTTHLFTGGFVIT